MSGQSELSWQIPMKCHSAAALGIQASSDSRFSCSSLSSFYSSPHRLLYDPFFCSPVNQVILHEVGIQLKSWQKSKFLKSGYWSLPIRYSLFTHNLQVLYFSWLWLNKSEVTELFLLDGRTSEKGRHAEKQKRGSELGSRHHLLRMFAAINLLCSSCMEHAATKMANYQVESAKGTYYLNANANPRQNRGPRIVLQELTADLSRGIYVFLGVTAAETKTAALQSLMNEMFEWQIETISGTKWCFLNKKLWWHLWSWNLRKLAERLARLLWLEPLWGLIDER